MNPKYLSKEELIYELSLRGINTDEEVQWLRKLFRTVVGRDVVPEARRLRGWDINELYSYAERKIHELQEAVSKPETPRSVSLSRVCTRLLHLRGRVHLLEEKVELGLNFNSDDLQRLSFQLDNIERNMATVEGTEKQGRDLGGGPGHETVSTMTDDRAEASVSAVQGMRPKVYPDVSRESEFHFCTYHRLPHPVSYLLKELPQVDGCKVEVLYEFLLKVIHLRQVSQVRVPQIYEILYPHCKGEMLVLLRQALVNAEEFDSFHSRLLEHCVPERQLSQLKLDRYERGQREGEPFVKYCQAIQDAALVLRINESETQIVKRILEGLTTYQRARFVFQSAPTNLQELERLFVIDRNRSYTEQGNRSSSHVTVVHTVQADYSIPKVRARQAVGERYHSEKTVICFRCGRAGHRQRD